MENTKPPLYKKNSLVDIYFSKLHALRPSDGLLFKGTLIVCFGFLLLFITQLSTSHTVKIATHGGTFTEGIVGTPRFINPVLAVSRADKDLSTLIYDGLMSLGENGDLVPNVAESVTVSDDGLTYNVVLKDNVTFHDGVKLTAKDILFTVASIQEPLLASPLRANFDGVSVEEVGEFEINFVLNEPYAPFLQNLTFGILPQHVWKEAGIEEFPFSKNNSEPIGSGAYKVEKIIRNASGIPEIYILKAFSEYHLGISKIEFIELHFFPTTDKLADAFRKGLIEGVVGIDQARLANLSLDNSKFHIERIPLPRTFAVFINQNKSPALRDTSARRALDISIDRTALINATLGGYGNPIQSPLPKGFSQTDTDNKEDADYTASIEAARDILSDGGWKLNSETQILEKKIDGTVTPLSFSISTANSSIFDTTADFLKNSWEKLGASVSVKQFEQSDLTQSVIRPRDYEALLFGTQLGRMLDFYSFWHSSQRNDPGLNISLYANITTDSILSEMRRSNAAEDRDKAMSRFVSEIDKEKPAIFLYSPELLYIFPNRILNASFKGVSEPHERFDGIRNWYIETESVWPFFTKNI
ncbi:MAG: peptide ABC transporter substrate-binding protein [Candidatus Pacebacteria bacterium]|nr:peptide ABC transporter substrate-binding protein [Candidatus Paceibacterota bacterium]MCF7857651.1 peptide ABC transporter substrate-binding protein [Candidatus Paceibacterota bacterium]